MAWWGWILAAWAVGFVLWSVAFLAALTIDGIARRIRRPKYRRDLDSYAQNRQV
jgi:threonine/homoserine/homoserine lactone efflux protein